MGEEEGWIYCMYFNKEMIIVYCKYESIFSVKTTGSLDIP